MDARTLVRIKAAGLWLALAAAGVIAAVLTLEHAYGYVPCKLCLSERLPYYAAVPLGLVALLAPERLARLALGLAALGLLYGAGLGVYHAGAEFGVWAGPTDCGGGAGAAPADVGGFLDALRTTRVVDCSVAALHVLGLSLAAWNALAAFALAALAGTAAGRA